MNPDSGPNAPIAPAGHCVLCGYDLRGSQSMQCPECGAPKAMRVAIADREQYHMARAALSRDGLLLKYAEPGGSMGTIGVIHGWSSGIGYLWVAAQDIDRAERCLDQAGVVSPFRMCPIVDRSEPICPACGVELDLGGPGECGQCGAPFQWVDVGDHVPDTTGKLCSCGYNLTGLQSSHCPECGETIVFDIAERVLEESDRRAREREEERRARWAASPRWARFLILSAPLALAGVLLLIQDDGVPESWLAIAMAGLIAIIVFASLRLSRGGRS